MKQHNKDRKEGPHNIEISSTGYGYVPLTKSKKAGNREIKNEINR